MRLLASGPPRGVTSVVEQVERDRRRWWVAYMSVLAGAGFLGLMAFNSAPSARALTFAALIVTCVVGVAQPFVGVYVIVFVTLVGDNGTMPWWPYMRGFSARESIMFLSDSILISPLEVLLLSTLASFLLQRLEDPTWRLIRGRLFLPIMAFSGMLAWGMVNGIARGGDRRTAIFEARALFYIPILYILVTNLLKTRKQYEALLWVAMTAVSIQSIFVLSYYRGLTAIEKEELEDLAQHTSTIHMDVLLLLIFALLLLRGSRRKLLYSIALAIPTTWAFVLSQRRAGMVALVIGFVVLTLVLLFRRRRVFWVFAPTAAIVGIGFIAATWNSTGSAGLLSTSVKSVIAPEELDAAERSSSLYRDIEAFDLWFTIGTARLEGRGFGRPFLMPLQLPDISFVEFWDVIPHNSVLYIWIKTGFFGFAAMMFLFARATQLGTRSVLAVRTGDQACTVLAGLAYVIMFLVFAYVDIAWDARSCVFLAVSFALCADYALRPDPLPSPALGPTTARAFPEMALRR